MPTIGYALVTGFTSTLQSNISFYSDSSRKHLSSIMANANYSFTNQYWSVINSNLFLGPKYNIVGDWRIYKFPTKTYGLGSKTTLNDKENISYKYLRLDQTIMREVTPNIYFGIGYLFDYYWNIQQTSGPINNYGLTAKALTSGYNITFQYDNRKNCINPQQGAFVYLQFRDNNKKILSDVSWKYILIDCRKYIPLSWGLHSVLAFWNYDCFTFSGKPPYLNLPSLGWDAYSNTGRGYVQGRYRGQSLMCVDAEYRFGITQNGILGGVVFANCNSQSEYPSNSFKAILPRAGFGLRIKVNKFSNTNFSADYAWGKDHSNGIFFNLGEVF